MILFIAGILVLVMRGAAAQERREGVIWGAFTFGKAHGVMEGLEDDMQLTLEAFLRADADTVKAQADVMVASMRDVAEAFPEPPGPEDDRLLWQALWDISKDARLMQLRMHEEKYEQGYGHFASLINRCMTCHQQRRVWSRFPDACPA